MPPCTGSLMGVDQTNQYWSCYLYPKCLRQVVRLWQCISPDNTTLSLKLIMSRRFGYSQKPKFQLISNSTDSHDFGKCLFPYGISLFDLSQLFSSRNKACFNTCGCCLHITHCGFLIIAIAYCDNKNSLKELGVSLLRVPLLGHFLISAVVPHTTVSNSSFRMNNPCPFVVWMAHKNHENLKLGGYQCLYKLIASCVDHRFFINCMTRFG